MIKRAPGGAGIRVTFELPAEAGAERVTLCGDFNDWSPTATPLSRSDDGTFRTTLDLPAGRRWHFRYLLDGHRWENDWAADDYAPNIYGGQDSVVDLTDTSPAPADEPPSGPPAQRA
jgi:1,4-alpha-glucan branching enzyme